MDVSAAVVMFQEILATVGRSFGVSAEYLRGGEGGGSRLIAGVEASRRQLAVIISSLQGPTAKFLQRVFAAFYRQILYEVLQSSRPMRDDHQETGPHSIPIGDGETTARSKLRRARSRSRERGAGEEDDGVVRLPKKGKKARSKNEPSTRIVIVFNNIPFLDYDKLRSATLDGIVKPDGFRDTVGRMYHIPQSELTTSYDNGPQELLLDPVLQQLEMQKLQKKQATLDLQQQKESGGAEGGASAKKPAVVKRVASESSRSKAHEAGPPTSEGNRVRRQKDM
jgi:hypothetical protein